MSTARLINYFVAQLSIFYRGFWLSSRCHIFRCLIHDPLTYDVRLYFMLYYKCVFIIIFGIVCTICTVVLCFKKMLNMVWFAIIIVVFAVRWIVPFVLMQHCGIITLGSLLICSNILCGSNMPFYNPSLAWSPRQWSSVRTRVTNSRAKSWLHRRLSWIHLNK